MAQLSGFPRLRYAAVIAIACAMLAILLLPTRPWLTVKLSAPTTKAAFDFALTGTDFLRLVDGLAVVGALAGNFLNTVKDSPLLSPALASMDRLTLAAIEDLISGLRRYEAAAVIARVVLVILPVLLLSLLPMVPYAWARSTERVQRIIAIVLIVAVGIVSLGFGLISLYASASIDGLVNNRTLQVALEDLKRTGVDVTIQNGVSVPLAGLTTVLGVGAALAMLLLPTASPTGANSAAGVYAYQNVGVPGPRNVNNLPATMPPPVFSATPLGVGLGAPAMPVVAPPPFVLPPPARPAAAPGVASQPAGATRFCSNCQKEIPVTAKYCKYCGSPQ